MLTPRNDDPNFVDEKLRKAHDPVSFGSDHTQRINEKLLAEAEKAAKDSEQKEKTAEAEATEQKNKAKR